MKWSTLGLAFALMFATAARAADFGSQGGPVPANIDAITEVLQWDAYDLELLISYGTSKGASAGHVALAVRDSGAADDWVYSANFYADRAPEHEGTFYTDDLMIRVPKKEYLFGTASSLSERASFGLDFGEIYKRSVIGVRVYGVPVQEKDALIAFFNRVNDDYRNRRKDTPYHDGEIVYGYMNLNCAKTIGMGFKYGAGYSDLKVKVAPVGRARKVKAAVSANIPTEMAMKLLKAWNARGYGMDVVLYKKFEGSTYVDPHDKHKVAFKDLPNRFPSVLSLDFLRELDQYKDFNNLYAVYILYNMGKYAVRVNPETRLLEIYKMKTPIAYPEASKLAERNARADREGFQSAPTFLPSGNSLDSSSLR